MPKYRKLWIKTVESHDINEMPDDFTRLLWIMLPLGLDSQGRGQDNMAWIKAKIMPLRDDVTHEQIEQAMQWYAERGMIERYEAGGRRYFWIPTFARYQGNTEKEAASEYPPPPSQTNSGVTRDLLQSNSGVTPELLQTYSGVTRDLLRSNSKPTRELLASNSGVTPDLLQTYSASQGDAQGDSDSQGDAEGESFARAQFHSGVTPEQVATNSEPTPELVASNSRVTPELLRSYSGVTPELLRSNSASQGDAYTQGDAQGEGDSRSRAQFQDPVEHMLLARAEMRAGIADPSKDAARWMQYRDDALKAYESATGLKVLPANRDAIVTLAAENGFTLERWKQSITTCVQNGVKPSNISCMIDTYRAGGDYKKMQNQRRGRENGHCQRRVETTTDPKPDLETINRIRAANNYAPLTQEQYDALE